MNRGLARHQSILLRDTHVKQAHSRAFCYRCKSKEPESEGPYLDKSFCIVKDPEKFVGSKKIQTVKRAQASAQGYLACNLISYVFLLCIH